MLKIFLVGLGTGYIVFTENGKSIIKKYMELSNSLANKGIDMVGDMIGKEDTDEKDDEQQE